MRSNIIDELNFSIEFNQRHCDRLQVEAKAMRKLIDKHKLECIIGLPFLMKNSLAFFDQKGGEKKGCLMMLEVILEGESIERGRFCFLEISVTTLLLMMILMVK